LKEKHAELIGLIGELETKRKLHAWYDQAIRRERKRSGSFTGDIDVVKFCRKVLEDLHQRTGIEYRLSKETKASIVARRNDGFEFEDFQKVHEIKVLHWLEDKKMINYLHPSTLYRPGKFDKYRTQWAFWQRDKKIKKQKAEIKQQESNQEEVKMTPEEAAAYRKKMRDILGNITKKQAEKFKTIPEKTNDTKKMR